MSTLGSMLLSERAAEEMVMMMDDGDFYRPAHREIFKAMRQLVNNAKPVDYELLKQELKDRGTLAEVGGEDYLLQIAEYVPSPSNASYYAQIVLDKAILRRLSSAGRDIVGLVHDQDERTVDDKIDAAEKLVFDVGQKRLGKDFQHIGSLAKQFFIDVDTIVETGQPILGLPTKFYDLDKVLTGLYGGDLSIVAARPSMGKTSFVLNIGLQVAQQRKGNVAIFSLEMSSLQLARRLVAMQSEVSGYVLKTPGALNQQVYEKLADACEMFYDLPIFIDDASDVNGLEVRGKCRRLKQNGGLALVIVDYLQLMRGNRKTENRVQEISDIARSLKSLAKELDVPVIALSQLNRSVENRENKRPQLSDIRESGSIEAEADVVMFIYRDNYYKARENPAEADLNPDRVETAEILIAKHRNGEVGTVELGFRPKYASFVNIEKGRGESY